MNESFGIDLGGHPGGKNPVPVEDQGSIFLHGRPGTEPDLVITSVLETLKIIHTRFVS